MAAENPVVARSARAEPPPLVLPEGAAPAPVASPHFPSPLHAYVWRNWDLVPLERLARVVGARPEQIRALGHALGLEGPDPIPADRERRSALTVIRRNWHLLPYDQLLALLDWTAEKLEFTLREDDFLFVKLGRLKPRCAALTYRDPDEREQRRAAAIRAIVETELPQPRGRAPEPLFAFVRELSRRPAKKTEAPPAGRFQPRFCYSYFALYGDPLLEPEADPYPEGYLERLAATGVDGVWLQGVLQQLAPFPWEPSRSSHCEERLENLRRLVARARRHGVGVYLYLNEPRALPAAFFTGRETLRGVPDGDHFALCTSATEVQHYLTSAVEGICRAVPDLAGFFTITASENQTNCWSHLRGAECPRCSRRKPAEVIAEVNRLFGEGIRRAGTAQRLLVWDWGWANDWAEEAIRLLPPEAVLQSVSEWDLPIRRGGVPATVGEYSISAIGPGPRATRHWKAARERGLKTSAKIQAGNTWELSAVPYIPAVANVAQHVANLREAGVDTLQLGWTLGGYPSPNLEVAGELGRDPRVSPEEALLRVASRRFGRSAAPEVVRAWTECSTAFREFPYHIGTVYQAPLQLGPANPLWEAPTGYRATMVGFPYDDLAAWRQVYPADIFARQFDRVADGCDQAHSTLIALTAPLTGPVTAPKEAEHQRELEREASVMEAAAIHFRSVANQSRYVEARNALATAAGAVRRDLVHLLAGVLRSELELARRLYALQRRDSRLGFEASNQYYYLPCDLAEKVLNCRDLLERWIPTLRD